VTDLAIAFLLGTAAGAGLTWSLSRAAERVRRIRYELRAAKKGLKTLRKMFRREGLNLIKVGGVIALIIGGVIAVLAVR
jgi:membrane protein YqaA with SNARE-associated domain